MQIFLKINMKFKSQTYLRRKDFKVLSLFQFITDRSKNPKNKMLKNHKL